MALLGPYLAAAALLAIAGVRKSLDPGDVATALAKVTSWPARRARAVVRAGATAEAVLGVAAVLRPAPVTAAAVAASYLAFAAYVARLRRVGGPLATCGCFGVPDTAPTRSHALVDLLLGAAAIGVATSGGDWLPALLAHQPGAGVPLLLAVVTATYLAFGVFVSMGRVAGVRALYEEVHQ